MRRLRSAEAGAQRNPPRVLARCPPFAFVQFAVNQFGYTGGGFRRYMLLPTSPKAVLRAGSYTFMLLAAPLIPVATLVLILFHPIPVDWRTVVLFVGCAVTSLFGMHALALYVALLAPRRGDYNASFGNDLSFAANVVVIGGMMVLLFVPRLLAQIWPNAVGPQSWWMVLPLAVLAAVFYFTSLRWAEGAFLSRREHLLGIMEGRG